MTNIDKGNEASRAIGGWGSMPDEYITNERVLSVASQVAEQIGHLHVADVWADFCELIEAQILIGYYPTPTRANG